MRFEQLLEVWRITERRNGAVLKTEYVEDRWVPLAMTGRRPDDDDDLIYASKSSTFEGLTIRRKSENN